jgi:hypothetical protein
MIAALILAAVPTVFAVQRGQDAPTMEPFISVLVSADTQSIVFNGSYSFDVGYASPFWLCAPAVGAQRRCRWLLGAYVCQSGTPAACSSWKDDAHSTAPLPVLPSGFYTVKAGNADGVSAPMTEPKLWCVAGAGLHDCPCRTWPSPLTTPQDGSTCSYP